MGTSVFFMDTRQTMLTPVDFTGYPMAQNLRAKLPSSDQLVVYDKNKETSSRFAQDTKGVEVADAVCALAEKSVCSNQSPSHDLSIYMMSFLFHFA